MLPKESVLAVLDEAAADPDEVRCGLLVYCYKGHRACQSTALPPPPDTPRLKETHTQITKYSG